MKDRTAILLETIRRWTAASRFSRTNIEPDEVVNEAYCRLVALEPLPEDDEELSFAVEQVVRHTIRDLKRSVTVAADVDELPLDEHPFYESETDSPEKQFEEVFGLFCESQPEPKALIFSLCRTHTKNDIAKIANLRIETVRKILRKMPSEFENFLSEQNEKKNFGT